MRALEKIRIQGVLPNDTLNYFLLKNPKFARFYLLPKIHKSLHNAPGRSVISNCGFYTENISSFLNHHLQPIAQKVLLRKIQTTFYGKLRVCVNFRKELFFALLMLLTFTLISHMRKAWPYLEDS